MGRREVLPLQQDVGQLRARPRRTRRRTSSYASPVDALVAPARGRTGRRAARVVGADVEQDRQRARGVDAADQRVERELADRDAHAADALVADAEDALAVGDDDDVDLLARAGCAASPASARGPASDRKRPRGPRADLAEALAALGRPSACRRSGASPRRARRAARRRALVAVLQRAQVDVAVEVAREPLDLRPAPTDLFLEGLHPGREQPEQATLPPFLRAERGALRVVGVRQQSPSSFHDAHPGRCDAMRGRACPRGARDRRPRG